VDALQKSKVKLVIINVISFLVLAFVIEGMIYLGLENPKYIPGLLLNAFREYYRVSDRNILQVTDCATYDSSLFYILKPGNCTFQNREFSINLDINTAGLRDDQASLDFPSVLALGDSYTLGWGVRQDESFPQIIEKTFGRSVLNAGASSYGTAREVTLLKRLLLDSVRLILWQYHANDFDENKAFLTHGNILRVRAKYSYDSLRKSIEKREKYYPFKHLYGITRGVVIKILKPQTPKTAEWREAQSFLEVIKQAGLRSDIRILVFKLDDYDKLNDEFVTAVDSLLRTPLFDSLNIQTLKMAHVLKEADYFVLDDHINKSGHEKIAAEIRSHVTTLSP
jgi:hypothetical protein